MEFEGGDGEGWCLFTDGGRGFTVPLSAVREVVAVDRLLRVPLSPPGIVGMFLSRRDLIPVARAGGPPPTTREGVTVLVLQTGDAVWGLMADPGTTRVEKEPPEDSGPGPGDADDPRGAPGASGWHARGGTLYTALDPGRAWLSVRNMITDFYGRSAALSPTIVSENA